MHPTLETKTLFVGFLVGLAHIASGLAIMITPSAWNVTPLASVQQLTDWLGYTNGFAGMILIAAGLFAVIGASRGIGAGRTFRAVLFAPQQTLLLLQLWSISLALVVGHYPDGYVPEGGAWFILADQVWAWLLAISHSIWLAAFIYGGSATQHGPN